MLTWRNSSGLRAQGSGLRAQGSGRRAQGAGRRAQGMRSEAKSRPLRRESMEHVAQGTGPVAECFATKMLKYTKGLIREMYRSHKACVAKRSPAHFGGRAWGMAIRNWQLEIRN